MSEGQPSDAEVIQLCRHGEVERFSLLVERYQDRIYNFSLRLLDFHVSRNLFQHARYLPDDLEDDVRELLG